MRFSRVLPVVFLLLLVFTFFIPEVVGFLLIVNAVLLLLHGLLQLYVAGRAAGLQRHHPEQPQHLAQPFVSIHLPTHAEPPRLVCATITAILQQDYPNFELLVLDNNTTDPELWQPVARHCAHLNGVRFFHLENVKGYKAGALNIGRTLTDERAKYIFTVDADYVMSRGCLSAAVAAAERSQAALVQLPQAYSNVCMRNAGLNAEYRHYFDLYARQSSAQFAMLGTGTLSLVRLAALDDIGGWPTSTITEDAELGLKFQCAGHKGVLLDAKLGRGKMPADTISLLQQRLRWIFGNFQTLLQLPFPHKTATALHYPSILGQLSAWINFSGLALLVLVAECLRALLLHGRVHTGIVWLAVSLLLTAAFFKFLVFWQSGRYAKADFTAALFTHYAYMGVGAFGWWDALFGLRRPFVRTSKRARECHWSSLPMGVAACLSGCTAVLFWTGSYGAALLTLVLAVGSWYAVYRFDRQADHTARLESTEYSSLTPVLTTQRQAA